MLKQMNTVHTHAFNFHVNVIGTIHSVLYNCVITSKTQARYNTCMNLHASHSLVKKKYFPLSIYKTLCVFS